MSTGSRREALGAYYFSVKLEVDGIQGSFFRSVSGLSSEAEVVELAEGGINETTHKLIGRTKFPNLVLKQGFAGPELFAKRQDFLGNGGKIKRFGGTIKQLGPNGKTLTWTFIDGWICKWQGPEYDASKNEVSVETIEIAHEGLTKIA